MPKIDLTPKINLLRMWMAQKANYATLFCEAVDNAFNAGARRISIVQRADRLSFEDDGSGITRRRLPALFTAGEHCAMPTTRIGQFGIGITTQAMAAANRIEVETVSSEGCFTAAIDWRDLLKGGEWLGDEPTPRPVIVGRHTGTLIVLSELKKIVPLGADKIVAELVDKFHPALKDGRQIVFNGASLPAFPDPAMTDIIDREFVFDGDRRAHLRAGILKAPSKRSRVHIALAHRVIMPNKSFACGKYGGIAKMFARIQLIGDDWKPTPLKDEFEHQEQRDELENEIAEAIRPILEKCHAASFNAKIAGIRERIIARLPPELAPARPKKKQKADESSPIKKRKRKGGNEIDPDKADDESGPAKTKRPRTGPLQIDFEGRE